MAAPALRWGDFGSVVAFDRMLDMVLDGIRGLAVRPA